MGRTTLKVVADHVGVSAKTVSNVVNGTGWVSADVKDRVRAAVIELGYHPNTAARQLRSGRTGLVSLAVPDLSQPYFAELASELVREAGNRSITVLVAQTNGDAAAEERIVSGVGMPAVDGVILSPLALQAVDAVVRTGDTPIVLLGEQVVMSSYPLVTVDNFEAAKAATNVLIESGRRRIAAIGTQRSEPMGTSRARLAGYRSALAEARIAYNEGLVYPVEAFDRRSGFLSAERLVASGLRFDAIFAFSDLLALGALRALSAARIAVPREVALVGFDGIDEGGYSTPTLTTVSPDKSAIARSALDRLLAAGDFGSSESIPFHVTRRASA